MSDSSFQIPENRGLIAWFAHNHVAANILMLLFLLGGFFSVTQMRTETFPSIDPKTITVSVAYPGATPYEVADSITSRAEEVLLGTEGVKRISSRASEGMGLVTVELEEFSNADDVYNDVETAINSLSDFPPEDAERPIITKTKITPSVLILALHGDVSEETLKYWAETLEDEIRALPDVALTDVKGVRDYQISIEVSEEDLRRYGLSMLDVGRIVSNFSIDVPAGTIESRQGDILLRVQERGYTAFDFQDIVLRTLEDGSKLYLGDVANIIDGFEDVNLVSRFKGQPAAFIHVSRSTSQDTLDIASVVKDYIETVELPEGLELTIREDETIILEDRINLMLRNAILGFMLVFIILLLFLDLKLAFWTSAAIPISFFGGLMFIYFMGYSLNMISLFALIVVLGIVVDDAIVTGESIFESQEQERKHIARAQRGENAVLRGVYQVIAPVTIGVVTTMAAFAPLIFSTGTLGQIIRQIPIVVIPILAVSLLEAYFILPAHLSNPKRWSMGVVAVLRNRFADGLAWFIENALKPFATLAMRWRYATVAAFIGIMIITMALFSSGIVRFVFFPIIEGDQISVSVTMEEGTPFNLTQDVMNNIEGHVQDIRTSLMAGGSDPFESISLSIGETQSAGGAPGSVNSSSANHLGQIILKLVPSDFRSYSAAQIETMVRKRIENIADIESLKFESSLIGEEADIEVELSHKDAEMLNRAAEELKEALSKIDGTKEVDDSFEIGKTEYVFELTDEGLAVGLTPADLGQQLRFAFFGLEVQRFQRGRSEVIVYVRYPKDDRESLTRLKDTRIRLADGSEVPLTSVASIKEQLGFSNIYTVDGRRIVSVTSDVDYEITTPNDIMKLLTSQILPDLQAKYTGLSFSFEGESREQNEDLASLGKNMLVALMIIYVLLGGQLRSYIQPVVIMSAIPFGVVGAVWGHFLFGHDLSFLSLFGIVALTGVVINDSVVLVDYYNNHKNDNADLSHFESLKQAIARRFRPILLTTLTTSLGLMPMLLEISLQAQFLIPMVISLATGIIFATVIILILVPCLILIINDIKGLKRFCIPS